MEFSFHLFSLLNQSLKIVFFSLPKTQISNCRTKRNARVSNATRCCYLPHRQVKRAPPGSFTRNLSDGIFAQNYFANLSGIAASAKLFGENGSRNMFTNLLKTNFLNKSANLDLDQNQLANTNTLTKNLMLSDQFSPSTTSAAKSRTDRATAGLSVAALNINLSSLGPLYSHGLSKESNSSNRVSRAASPALGNSADNRFKLETFLVVLPFVFVYCLLIDNVFLILRAIH